MVSKKSGIKFTYMWYAPQEERSLYELSVSAPFSRFSYDERMNITWRLKLYEVVLYRENQLRRPISFMEIAILYENILFIIWSFALVYGYNTWEHYTGRFGAPMLHKAFPAIAYRHYIKSMPIIDQCFANMIDDSRHFPLSVIIISILKLQ